MSRAPRPTLYIHAGSHKTGTTAIEQAMHTGARELRAQGICSWPLLGPVRGHSRLVRAVYDDGARSRVKARWLAARIRWQSRGLPTTVLNFWPYRVKSHPDVKILLTKIDEVLKELE